MLQKQRSAPGSARWWDCRYGIDHKLGHGPLEELSPHPIKQDVVNVQET